MMFKLLVVGVVVLEMVELFVVVVVVDAVAGRPSLAKSAPACWLITGLLRHNALITFRKSDWDAVMIACVVRSGSVCFDVIVDILLYLCLGWFWVIIGLID